MPEGEEERGDLIPAYYSTDVSKVYYCLHPTTAFTALHSWALQVCGSTVLTFELFFIFSLHTAAIRNTLHNTTAKLFTS